MPVRDANTGTTYGETMQSSMLGELSLNEYQRRLHTYKAGNYSCHALGLVGELGEVIEHLLPITVTSCDHSTPQGRAALQAFQAAAKLADMVKKYEHHGTDKPSSNELLKELGDALWYITAVAGDFGLTLEQVAQANIAKLRARYPDGFVKGGGNRDESYEHKSAGIEVSAETAQAIYRDGDVSLAGGVPTVLSRPTQPAPNAQAGLQGQSSSAFQPVPQEPKLSYGDALHIIEAHYKAGMRDIAVAPQVFEAYADGTTPVTRYVPTLAYKMATVRKIKCDF